MLERATLTMNLSEIIEGFRSVDVETRLELLLDYSKQLPQLDARHAAERDAGLHRVPECMSPVFLWIEEGDAAGAEMGLRLILDVAEEAPTIRGLLAIIGEAFDGERAEAMAEIPLDLVNQLRLDSVIRMNRAFGIAAIITRIRNAARAYLETTEQGNL